MAEPQQPPHALPPPIAVLLKGYPRLSETFIAQELLALERRGLSLRLYSLRRPTDKTVHPVHREIAAPVDYLPEYLYQAPWSVLRGWWRGRRRPGWRAARRAFLKDLRRDRTPNRVRRFGQALVLAERLPPEISHLYAHFLHTPASVARYAALLTGRSWSCSAHAKDIWTIPDWEKREKLAEMQWLVTCTASGAAHLRALAPAPEKVTLVYHGLDLGRFPPPPAAEGARDGRQAEAPVRLLSVGRAVPKKGYDDLLQALALLPPELAWRLTHVGGGEEAARLKTLAERLGLAARIDWRGALPQQEVLALYRSADLFVLASKVAADGDRDGLPNVLMEAASQRLASLATRLPGIEELLEDGTSALLVPPGDPAALSQALVRLIGDSALRRRLGEAAEARVRRHFDAASTVEGLARRLGAARRPLAASLAG
jgi:glycosyltransferase involved in cell wall biosynthesis